MNKALFRKHRESFLFERACEEVKIQHEAYDEGEFSFKQRRMFKKNRVRSKVTSKKGVTWVEAERKAKDGEAGLEVAWWRSSKKKRA